MGGKWNNHINNNNKLSTHQREMIEKQLSYMSKKSFSFKKTILQISFLLVEEVVE